jgi:NADH-quinone oxidoreductase subunit G
MSEKMSDLFDVTIDGIKTQVKPGTTVLEAAASVGIEIPYLCHEPRLRPFGACRVCLVEVKGGRGPIPACTSPVGPNMEVTTSNEKIDSLRRNVLELLLIHHPLDCPVCDKAGECTLQDLVYKYGPTTNRYLYKQDRAADPVDHRSPFIERNNNRCVLCGACARICNEVQSVGEISFVSRGFQATVGTIFDRPLDCEFCGQCISACPVGALNNGLFVNRSRVWDLQKTESTCGICGNGCAINVEHRNNKVYRITHDVSRGPNGGILCGKGRFGYNLYHEESRLTEPLIKRDGEFVAVSWDEALDTIAVRLMETLQQHGPSAVGALGSPHGTNEDAKALKLLFGNLLRVKNLDSQARYFLAPTLEVIGEDTANLDDLYAADLILVVNSATTDSQPVLGNKLIKQMRLAEVPMLVVDSRRTKHARFADVWLDNFPGTSAEVLAGLLAGTGKAAGTFDAATPEAVEKAAGVDPTKLKKAAALLAGAKNPLIVLGTLPYAEELNGSAARAAYAMAKALGGKVMVPSEKANLRGLYKYGVRPVDDGLDATEMIEQAGQGAVKAMYVCGENPVANFPGGEIAKNLKNLDFLVVSDLFMTATAELADVVLPAAGYMERSGTLTNFEGTEQPIFKAVDAPGLARPDDQVLIELGVRMRHNMTRQDLNRIGPVDGWTEPGLPELTFKDYRPAPEGHLRLLAGPVLFHCGTLTSYSEDLNKIYGEPLFEISEPDAKALGISHQEPVRIVTSSGAATGKAFVSKNVTPGVVFAPLHFPDAGVNRLFGDEVCGETACVKIEKDVKTESV